MAANGRSFEMMAAGLLARRARVFRRNDRPKRETRREELSRLGRTVNRPRSLRLYRCCRGCIAAANAMASLRFSLCSSVFFPACRFPPQSTWHVSGAAHANVNLICRLFVLYADGETSWSSWTDFGWEICDDPPRRRNPPPLPVRRRAGRPKGSRDSVPRSRRQNGQR